MCSGVKPLRAVWVSVCACGKIRLLLKVLTDSALVIHGVVVGFVVGPARLADGLGGYLLCALGFVFLLSVHWFARFGFASFRFSSLGFASLGFASLGFASLGFASLGLAFGHGTGLGGLARAFAGRLAALLTLWAGHGALWFLLAIGLLSECLLAVALLAWILLLLLLLSIAVLVLLAILIFALQLLVIALFFLLAVTLVFTLLAILVLAHLLTVGLLATVLRHSFGKLRLKDQVTG